MRCSALACCAGTDINTLADLNRATHDAAACSSVEREVTLHAAIETTCAVKLSCCSHLQSDVDSQQLEDVVSERNNSSDGR